MNIPTSHKKRLNGFTLVEMAIVLVIAGLVLSAVMSMGNALISQSRISATKTKQEAIKTALISYIARNNRMPCPAVPNIAPSTPLAPTTGYGVEALVAGDCTGVPNSGEPVGDAKRVVVGIVPWITLGLSDDAGQDGYYNRFSYAVTSNATSLNKVTIAGMVGNITIHTASPIVLAQPPNPLSNQSNDCSNGAAYNPCSIVAVIISHGANANGAYTKSGNQVPFPLGADELENTNIDPAFVQKDFAVDKDNPFDDVLLTLNASDLLSPLTLNGSLKDYNAVLTNDFANITAAITANAIRAHIISGTGTPFVLTAPAMTVNDPWGNPIVVSVPTPPPANEITNTSIATNPAFTLTSRGADGAISGDDIQVIIPISQLYNQFTNAGW